MNVPRRGFLKTGVIAAVASSLPAVIRQAAFARPVPGNDPLQRLGFGEFSSCLGEWFEVGRRFGRSDRIRLVRVDDLRSDAAKGDRALAGKECFALVFSGADGKARAFGRSRGAEATVFAESQVELRHDRLGDFPLFVSPAGSDADGPLYIAVINRLYS
jgi:hypothetical protein